ncbi:CitMHS family transporter [Paracoccus laeviglucosivorans]|uniref:Citrate-Mg2+:H+ or citrate-Ca2+:H+ symporter, CitMHS family n=1 Tax=Paracoccus laeviglucosivorans TaxID=1197861 RepID=A0A521FAJ0_9RHOB|nr:citrate:proton symporter [Paracoccus laeviglucosivorans]SMO93176.1 citrate-Mg2+:H+ or citrate-Ca2+:H+ symporter, CitMHS family [Paracoccus laeviglucosivorans]
MTTLLAYSMIAVFMASIMSGRLSALIALILVPLAFATLSGYLPVVPDMMIDGIRSIAPTGVLLMFAILYFGLMIDVGLFDPIVRRVIRISHGDPMRVVVGTAILSSIISLDGDGSTTYMLCVTAMMPMHRRLGINPLILPAMILMPNAIMNIMPWGGPSARAMAALNVDAGQVVVPLLPAMALATLGVLGIAYFMGLRERARIGKLTMPQDRVAAGEEFANPDPSVQPATGWRAGFNIALTVGLMCMLVIDIAPLPILFMIAFGIAITVNFPNIADQRERIASHAPSALAVSSVIFAAGVFTGILNGTGMTDALAQSILYIIPEGHGDWLPLITAIASAPFTFFLSNDAFYFGVVPVLAQAAAAHDIPPEVIARASLVGQPLHQLSPLVPSLYLLMGLAKVELGEFLRFTVKWALIPCLLMLLGTVLTGVIPLPQGLGF